MSKDNSTENGTKKLFSHEDSYQKLPIGSTPLSIEAPANAEDLKNFLASGVKSRTGYITPGTDTGSSVSDSPSPDNSPSATTKKYNNNTLIPAIDPNVGLTTPKPKRKSPEEVYDHPLFSVKELELPQNPLAVQYGKASEYYQKDNLITKTSDAFTAKERAEFEKQGVTPQYIAGMKAPKESELYKDAIHEASYLKQFMAPKTGLPKDKEELPAKPVERSTATLEIETIVKSTEAPVVNKSSGGMEPVFDPPPASRSHASNPILLQNKEEAEKSDGLSSSGKRKAFDSKNIPERPNKAPPKTPEQELLEKVLKTVKEQNETVEKKAEPSTWLSRLKDRHAAVNEVRHGDKKDNTFANRRKKFTETWNDQKADKQKPQDGNHSRGRD